MNPKQSERLFSSVTNFGEVANIYFAAGNIFLKTCLAFEIPLNSAASFEQSSGIIVFQRHF